MEKWEEEYSVPLREVDMSDEGFVKIVVNGRTVAILSVQDYKEGTSLYIDFSPDASVVDLESELHELAPARMELMIPKKG